ncbi:DUF3099 domain-containing protein [Streptomyces gobiensis]|uniref:DUF3099 domain-containing protein n=1 Tax=Streptomyces gobiensis TaxID=2875706 RepID=UPI001E284454|nr:DUF3099 domain-containing protein [Streptomyces gobiensis]UGY94108.1 DUF3099 domain-containing protein [Streptomyces gobiensis]
MYTRRRRRYFALMTVCLTLFISAWAFVRLFSVPLAVAMCVIAAAIPPIAVIVANKREADDRWWDEEAAKPVEIDEFDELLWEEELRNDRPGDEGL